MNTRDDIRDGEQLTITVQVTEIDEWENHDSITRKVICNDVEGNRLSLTIFHNNDAAEFNWDVDRWYKLKNATGNVYRGDKQLKPSYEFGIVPLDEPPEKAVISDTSGSSEEPVLSENKAAFEKATDISESGKTTADGGATLAQRPLNRGNYLLHFPMGDLSELKVHVYKLNVPGGLDPSDEDLNRGVIGFTAKAAALYRYRSRGPVTTDGPLKVYAVNKLTDELVVDGYTVQPEHVGMETLEARSFDDQDALRELVKQDVKAALEGKYDVTAINSIVEHTPLIKAKSGDFTASREYACRLWVDPDGTVICGVAVSLQFESTFSAAEYVQKGYDIHDVAVTHDTELYEKDATGTVSQLIDQGYTDYDDQLGCSVAEWHEKKGRVEADVVESLKAGEVVMAEIDYNGWKASQALNLCRVVPTLEELKRVDSTFHSRALQESRMLPDERFTIATSFVRSVGETPTLGLKPEGQPANVCYEELVANTRSANLRFASGNTASYGKVGLDRYGIHQAPDSLDLLALYPKTYTEEAKGFLDDLLGKLTAYGAKPTSLEQESYALGKEFSYTQVGQSASECDCVVAVVPDPDWVAQKDGIDDPYPELKTQLGQQKIPSQMVTVSSLGKDAYLGNIAAGVVAKAGGIPWRIDEVPGGADVFIGLDVTYDPETGQHLGASANIVLADGTILASESVSLQQGEKFQVDDIIGILKNLIRIYVKQEGHPPNHVVIHRDGQYYLDREDLVERLEEASEFIPKFDLVEIRKSGNPRIGEYTGDSFEVAEKGVGFVSQNGEHAYLATTGKPELKPGNSLGTPRPIRVVKRHGSTDLKTLTKQVYWLSESHVASISRSTRLPITTYYADRCADYARNGYLLNDELIQGVPYV